MAISLLNDKLMIAATLIDGVLAPAHAANYRFRPDGTNNGIVRFALLTNNNATGDIKFRINNNASTSGGEATVTDYDGLISPGNTVDISFRGTRLIKDVSVFVNAGATTIAVRLVGLA